MLCTGIWYRYAKISRTKTLLLWLLCNKKEHAVIQYAIICNMQIFGCINSQTLIAPTCSLCSPSLLRCFQHLSPSVSPPFHLHCHWSRQSWSNAIPTPDSKPKLKRIKCFKCNAPKVIKRVTFVLFLIFFFFSIEWLEMLLDTRVNLAGSESS